MIAVRAPRGLCTVLLVSSLFFILPLPNAYPQSIADIVDRIRPGVAVVQVREPGGTGSATAFVVHPDGYLLTALHVVLRATEIQVGLGGQTEKAEVVGLDRANDLALLRVPRTGITSLPLSATSPRTGEEVVVVGFPLSEVIGTQNLVVTRGIVSTLHPALPQTLQGLLRIAGPVVQVDAAMNPGISGGPVLNQRGEVIGIAVGALRPAASINFAIPAETAQTFLKQILADAGAPQVLSLPVTRTQPFDLAHKTRSGFTVMPKERVLEVICSQAPPPQAIGWVRYEGRLTIGTVPLAQAARMGIFVWLSSPSGAPQEDEQASFGRLFIVPSGFRYGIRSGLGWSRSPARMCLNYEVRNGDLVGGHLFETHYTIDLLSWTVE